MAAVQFQVLPANDAAVVRAFLDAWQALGNPPGGSFDIQVIDGANRSLNGPIDDLEKNEAVARLRVGDGRTILSMNASFPNSFSIGLARARAPQWGNDTVTISGDGNMDPATMIDRLVAIRDVFRSIEPTQDLDRALGPALADFYRRREEALLRLEEANQTVIQKAVDLHLELDKRLSIERERLLNEIDAQRTKLVSEYEQRDEELSKREETLAEIQKTIDTSKSTHARRHLRMDLKKILGDRSASFSLTKETNAKRIPIHALFAVLLIATGSVLGVSLFRLYRAATSGPGIDAWVATAEVAFAALSFIGSTAFYIQWNDAWARRHADEEFKLQRLNIDVDRASWVVEVALEFNEEKGLSLPPELMNRLSANLFADSDPVDAARHPAQDIAGALFGASSSLRIAGAGSELTIDRKGIQRLQREAYSIDGGQRKE